MLFISSGPPHFLLPPPLTHPLAVEHQNQPVTNGQVRTIQDRLNSHPHRTSSSSPESSEEPKRPSECQHHSELRTGSPGMLIKGRLDRPIPYKYIGSAQTGSIHPPPSFSQHQAITRSHKAPPQAKLAMLAIVRTYLSLILYSCSWFRTKDAAELRRLLRLMRCWFLLIL